MLQVLSPLCGSDKKARRRNFVFAVFSLGWIVKKLHNVVSVMSFFRALRSSICKVRR